MNLYIVSGFLGSGKTRLINRWLAHPDLENKRILCVQTENGRTKLTSTHSNMTVHTQSKDWWSFETFTHWLTEHQPDYIFIEINGFEKVSNWCGRLFDSALWKSSIKTPKLKQIVHCIKAKDYDAYHAMMPEHFDTERKHADHLYITHTGEPSYKAKPTLSTALKAQLKSAEKSGVSVHYDCEENPLIEDFSFVKLGAHLAPEWSKPFVMSALILAGIYLLRFASGDDGRFSRMLLSFSGMIYQAFPFLMAGIFIASFIRVYVSENAILKWFPKNKFLATCFGLFGGLLLPVCDCSIIPVSTQLLKKGVPANAAYTFMFAAPLVNPIAIMATFFAFPENPGIMIYRILAALVIATISGLIFSVLLPPKAMKDTNDSSANCSCQFCQIDTLESKLSKPMQLLLHAGEEFVQTAPYLLLGAIVASVFQIYGSDGFLSWLIVYPPLSLLLMIFAAFLLSVCSSSDAFIGRSLVSQFTLQSVMGFLVLGAMMDVKNMALLLKYYTAKQVALMTVIIVTLGFVVISIGNQIAALII